MVETPVLLIIMAIVYVWIAIGYAKLGQAGMCLAFCCYAGANVGFAWEILK